MKILSFFKENILFVITLFLLAFIPLYPKLPLLDIKYTWVYIRIEDFLVAAAVLVWIVELLRKKATLKTPLTIPIIVFWIVGGLATLYAVLVFFPHMANVHPEIALLHYARRIEYLILFFVAASSIRNKEFVKYIVATLAITLLLVCLYGFGQKFLGFPAFLTMNEEFAKGTPLTLSQAGRVASTFAGHYDLAAYLVLMASIMGSLALGVKKISLKIGFSILVFLSLSLLLLTTSRVSFIVWFLSMIFLLIIRKTKIQKKFLFAIPVLLIIIFSTSYFSGIIERFSDTVSRARIVIDAKTGSQLGIAKEIIDENSAKKITIEEKQSTGEELPQGSKYISLPTAKVERVNGTVIVIKHRLVNGEIKEDVTTNSGTYLIKNVFAYDVSFTTRLQGTWPRAINAFNRSPLTGSGYSSIDVGTDGNYLRILGEVGILGFISFAMIFIVFGIYVSRVLPSVNSPLAKSLIYGVVAGIFGIALNAVLIDVFEASKIAFTLWMLIGITIGILKLYEKEKVDIADGLKKVLTSIPAIILYFFLGSLILYWKSLGNYFVGDDFTWLRWSADCAKEISSNMIMECESIGKTLLKYFTEAGGFFYRPGTKLYFFGAYTFFGLNPTAYHFVSNLSHFLNTTFVFLISQNILRSKKYAIVIAILFLTASTHSETINWISSINHLLASTFLLLSLLLFIHWKRSRKHIYLVFSIICVFLSPLFHELGVVAPLIIIAYDLLLSVKKINLAYLKNWYIYPFLLQIPIYLYMRSNASSHWMQGDYSYNLMLLPFNFLGNLIGYKLMIFLGRDIIPIHQTIRGSLGDQIAIVTIIVLTVLIGGAIIFKKALPVLKPNWRLYVFGTLLFILPLLPFLGLGNITQRYSYLASFGLFFTSIVLLRQFYQNTKIQNRSFLKYILLSLLALFIVFHIFTLQRANNDWRSAGEITKNVQKKFKASNLPNNVVLYFVNTPITSGEAWVFPVGLEDAIWFALPDGNHGVRSVGSKEEAYNLTSQSPNTRIYQFTPTGNLTELK
jgi:hypothetical protein